MKHYINALFLMALTALYAQSNALETNTNKWIGNRPDGHAPISVMGDHTHGKGELMFSYRFMSMTMEDLKIGNEKALPTSILISNGGEYMVAPISMPMDMHMLGLMYAPSHRITLTAMANYTSLTMDHITAMGGQFTTVSSGFGDFKLGMLYKIFIKNNKQFHGNFLISLPTGAIGNKDATPASNGKNIILPYPMQIGSGTFNTTLGLTYLAQCRTLSYGMQLTGVLRIGENSNNYRLGNHYSLNNWFAINASKWLSFSARLEGVLVDKIAGANPVLNPNMIITADTKNSGGTFINSGLGFNLYVPNGTFKNLRFGVEFATPIFQNVKGIQLKTKDTFTLGLQYAL